MQGENDCNSFKIIIPFVVFVTLNPFNENAMSFKYSNNLKPVVAAKEMAEIDRFTIEKVGIPGMVLMENAGREVVAVIREMLGTVEGKNIYIFCGKGNNGGDGYVVARYLLDMGANVKTYLVGKIDEVKGDAGSNLRILRGLGHSMLPISSVEHVNWNNGAHLLVDALLGTGVRGVLTGLVKELVEKINEDRAPIISVDLPTGVEADTGAVGGTCIQAKTTVTMGYLKNGLLLTPGRKHAGDVIVADIGIPRAVLKEKNIKCFQLTADYVNMVLPKREADTFKNRCGQVFLLAGSIGLTGAAVLSSEAVLRIGAGMALLGIPKSLNATMEEKLTEVMTLPLPETDQQSLSFDAKKIISGRFQWANSLAVGPGLSTHSQSAKLVKWILENFGKPVVLDADAINCLKDDKELLKTAKSDLILTPHPGELSKLVGMSTKEILANPIEIAREQANKLNVILVLKGAPTIIASPDGYVFINSTGNPGMATAGMGDVLTGAIAGLIAQGMSPLDGALAGVYLHGVAGDISKSELGEAGLLAGDVLRNLPLAVKTFEDNK